MKMWNEVSRFYLMCCAYYILFYLSYEWFTNATILSTLRKKIRLLCKGDLDAQRLNTTLLPQVVHIGTVIRHCASSCNLPLHRIRRKRLLVYQRNSNRKFVNLYESLHFLISSISNGGGIGNSRSGCNNLNHKDKQSNCESDVEWTIDVLHHDDTLDPCVLFYILQSTDILLTTHGFQEISMFYVMCYHASVIPYVLVGCWLIVNCRFDISASWAHHGRDIPV
jgi:hypothetical protein